MDLSMGKLETGLACVKKQGTKKSDNYYDGELHVDRALNLRS